ncbi:GPP34 family phosphoprotein [Streptomyces sp. NPDC005423]|uniref:GOLPH3/VPS74 family protein n=1 Tax=Streptomyces sp. NPDC005423 TaxID=3155343 RepID=UPI0033AC2135
MSTARDLMIVTLDVTPGRPVESGDLSLALAGAELIDLNTDESLTLDGDRILPNVRLPQTDPLLDEASAALLREEPYEPVEEWLWRRGQGLSKAYVAVLEAEGQIARQRGRWIPVRTGRTALVDSPARQRAGARWAAGEPVLAALAAAVGIRDLPVEDDPGLTDESRLTVLAAVHDAVMELEGVRQRRKIEDAAFDNIWRGQ